MLRPEAEGEPLRRATAFAVAVTCLLLVTKLSEAVSSGEVSEVPWVTAAFVLPLLYAIPATRRFLDRNRWPVLAAEAVLTWVPFAVFGIGWVGGIGSLLAALMLLMVGGPVSWLAAGLLWAADVIVRIVVIGLPAPWATWPTVLWTVLVFVNDGLMFFGIVRLAQIVTQVEQARTQARELAVERERLQAAESLRSAVGDRLAEVAALVDAARRARDTSAATVRVHAAAAGRQARHLAAQARAVSTDWPGRSGAELAAASGGEAVIGARLAWAVLITMLSVYTLQGFSNVSIYHDGFRLGASLILACVLIAGLQLRHSGAARQGHRPRYWQLTLALQAVLVYVFFLPPLTAYMSDWPFLAGSILLLVPGRWRWAGFAAVLLSWPVLYAVIPLHGITAADRHGFNPLYEGTQVVAGLELYGLSQLAGLARQLEELRGQVARMAAVRERLRVARDMHDLLGLGLSAVALKADLISTLTGRDDKRAATELDEMARICASARADIRLVTGPGQRLSLAAEIAAAQQVMTSAGIQVRAFVPAGPLPSAADEVLAPVLREAVTNILRHAAASACLVEVANGEGSLRMRVTNDGAADRAGLGSDDDGGRGLANMTARVRAAGGHLSFQHARGQFELDTEVPVVVPGRSGSR